MSMDQICLPIRQDLEAVESALARETTSSVDIITQVIQFMIANKGKRLRPALTILAARMAGYHGEQAPIMGAMMEMVHTASLMHDDVIDNAAMRRGRPSANAQWGNQISVLVGDFFWCKACEIMVRQGNPRILRAVTDTITATTEGEVLEVVKSNDINITEEEYLKVIQLKTAVLLSACGQVGAILGDVSESYESAMRRYGYDLGIAFQLADDYLDYIAEEERLGKSTGTDLREGKVTLPLIVALKRADDSERQSIKDAALAKAITSRKLAEVLEIIKRHNGLAYTADLARHYITRAKSHLEPFKPSIEKDALFSLADYVIERGE